MNQRTPGILLQATLTEIFAPVARYEAALKRSGKLTPHPPVPLRAVDAFLMQAWAAITDPSPTLVDLAGEATGGRSTVLWNSLGFSVETPATSEGWGAVLGRILRDEAQESAHSAQMMTAGDEVEGLSAPSLVCLAAVPGNPTETIARLNDVHDRNAHAVILLLPLGPIGDDPAVGPLLAWSEARGLRLNSMRDLSPSLESSRVAVMAPAADPTHLRKLERLRLLFASNLDMLALAARNFELAYENGILNERIQELRSHLVDAQTRAEVWEKNHRDLDAEFFRLREWGQATHTACEEVYGRLYQVGIVSREWEARHDSLVETVEELRGHLSRTEDRVTETAQAFRREEALRQSTEAQIVQLTSGRGWAVLRRLSRLKARLASSLKPRRPALPVATTTSHPTPSHHHIPDQTRNPRKARETVGGR